MSIFGKIDRGYDDLDLAKAFFVDEPAQKHDYAKRASEISEITIEIWA